MQIELLELKTRDGIVQIPIITPKDKAPLPFEKACVALRGNWEKHTLGYKIRAIEAIGREITRSLGLSEPSKLMIQAGKTADSSVDSEYCADLDAVLYRLDSLSADKVIRIIPHEYFHSCQFKLAHLLVKDSSLVSEQDQQNVGKWFNREYISAYSEDTLGYLTQDIELDAFKFTVDFAKKHNLSPKEAEFDLASAKLAKRKSTHEIFADPKKHMHKLAAIMRHEIPNIGTFKPGGHIAITQKMNGTTIPGIQAFRLDETLNENPSLSNILAHLAHEKAPFKVALMLPGRATNKAMCGHLAITYEDEMFVHPRYVLEDMKPSDITDDKVKHLGQENIVRHTKPGVRADLKNAKQKANMSILKKTNKLTMPRR